jgi:hypothetical protein
MWRLLNGYYIRKKRASVAVIVADREHLIRNLEWMLDGLPEWSTEAEAGPLKNRRTKRGLRHGNYAYFTTRIPVVSIYHDNGMHKKVSSVIGSRERYILGWPSANEVRREIA